MRKNDVRLQRCEQLSELQRMLAIGARLTIDLIREYGARAKHSSRTKSLSSPDA
jgi:hypothetical protein